MSDALRGLYQDLILDHARRKVGYGDLEHADHSDEGRNPLCGDEVKVELAVDDAGVVTAFGWTGDGCSISQASASVLGETAPGLTIDELQQRIEMFRELLRSRGEAEPDEELLGDAVAFTGVARFPMRVKCAALAWVTAESALLTRM